MKEFAHENFVPSNGAASNTTPSTPTWAVDAADEHALADSSALPARDLRSVNLDVPTLVARVRAALPQLRLVEQGMLAKWRSPPVGQVDRLLGYAHALERVHTVCLGLAGSGPDAAGIARELGKARRDILAVLRGFVRAGVIDGARYARYEYVRGYRSLARAVVGIVGVCRAEWAQLQNRSPLTPEGLEHAFELAVQLELAVHARQHPPEPLRRALLERRQLFTLLIREYTRLRQASQFLYWRREEVEQLVPSLYRKKPRALRTQAPAIREVERSGLCDAQGGAKLPAV